MVEPSNYEVIAITQLCYLLLNDPSEDVRCGMAEALGKIGQESAIPCLSQALNDSSPKVRLQAGQAIANIYRSRRLLILLAKMSENPKVQMNFNAAVTDVAGNVEGNMLVNASSEAKQNIEKTQSINEKQVFISYSWREESNELANQLQKTFAAKGITIIRDKTDLEYKGLIQEFMQQIGQGKCVILIISDAYLKSHNCMFELVEIARNGEFYERIFPIVFKDAKISQAIERLRYIRYWDEKIKELESEMKQGSLGNLQGITDDLDLYIEIRNNIARLTDILKNMNTLNLDIHRQEAFQQLIQAVENKLSFESV